MAQLAGCASRIDLERFVDQLRLKQAANIRRLRELSVRAQPESRLEDANAVRMRLRTALMASGALTTLVKTADQASEDVSSRVRECQVVWERARAAREYVDTVLELKDAMVTMYGAIETRDWERAAAACQMARNVPQDILESEFAARMVPTIELPDEPPQLLRAAADDMAALFAKEFDKATQSRQMAALTRYFKLFPLVGYDKLGLEKYSLFICQIIAGHSRGLLTGEPVPNFYGVAMSRLLEHVAAIVNQHAPLIQRYYSDAAMSPVIQAIQKEVDRQGGLIIDVLWDERRMERLLSECRNYSFPGLVQSFLGTNSANGVNREQQESIDLLPTSASLAELATVLNRWSLYCDFVSQWVSNNELASDISEKIRTLLGPTWSALALYVFRRSVEKAVELDELPAHTEYSEDEPLVSSMVDDVMYVLSSLLKQAADSGVPEARDPAISGFRRVLESDYVGTIQRKLRDASPTLRTQSLPFLVYLNNLQVTTEYVRRAVDKYESLLPQLHYELSDRFRNYAEELLVDGSQTLVSLVVAPHVRQALGSAFSKGSYLLSPTEPETRRAAQFEVIWRQLSRTLRKQLHPAVYERVAALAAAATAQALEKYVWSLDQKVNDIGAIALDRDISRVIAVMSETKYSLRQRFVRVAQIVTLLSDDDVVMDTVLTAEEIHKVRTMKVHS